MDYLFSETIDAILIILSTICGAVYSIVTANPRTRYPQSEEANAKLEEFKKRTRKAKEDTRGGLSISAGGGEVSFAGNTTGALSEVKK